jgi:hypothetical protein
MRSKNTLRITPTSRLAERAANIRSQRGSPQKRSAAVQSCSARRKQWKIPCSVAKRQHRGIKRWNKSRCYEYSRLAYLTTLFQLRAEKMITFTFRDCETEVRTGIQPRSSWTQDQRSALLQVRRQTSTDTRCPWTHTAEMFGPRTTYVIQQVTTDTTQCTK